MYLGIYHRVRVFRVELDIVLEKPLPARESSSEASAPRVQGGRWTPTKSNLFFFFWFLFFQCLFSCAAALYLGKVVSLSGGVLEGGDYPRIEY